MTAKGICSTLVGTGGTVINAAFAADVKALGATFLRAPLDANHRNLMPVANWQHGANVALQNGVEPYLLLDFSFNQPWAEYPIARDIWPNEKLGYLGNLRWNRFIKDSCHRAELVASYMASVHATTFLVGNEPNTLGDIAAGSNLGPHFIPGHDQCTAPEVALSYGYEMAHWLKQGGAKKVYLGALSWIAGSGANPSNPYCALYLSLGLHYLHYTRALDWPFDGITLNCEGYWTRATAKAMADAVQKVLSNFHIDTPLLIGEWGVETKDLDAAKAAETYDALCSVAEGVSFFQHLQIADWGCRKYAEDGSRFVLGDKLPWYDVLAPLA